MKRWFTAAALYAPLLVLAGISALAQLTPDAPVLNFHLPMFAPEGHKIWDLRGAEGRQIGARRVEITEMRLLVYAQSAPRRAENIITADQAVFSIESNKAEGPGRVQVEGANFILEGKQWEWNGGQRQLKILKGGRLAIEGGLGSILE